MYVYITNCRSHVISDGPDVFVIGGRHCVGFIEFLEVGYFNLDNPADDLHLLNELPNGLGGESL